MRVDIHGASTTDEERQHRRDLEALINGEGLTGVVTVGQPVARSQVPALVHGVDAVVNTTWSQPAGGALDKVVYEAAACAVPVLACNPYFDAFLGDLPLDLLFASDDDVDLSRVLLAFAEADPALREETGRELRRRVVTGHSIDSWADAVVATVRRLHD